MPSSLEIQMKRETDCRRWNKNIFLLDALVLFGLISIISLRQSGDCPSATHMIKCLQWWICIKRWSSRAILSGGFCSILPWGNIKYYDWACYQFQHIAIANQTKQFIPVCDNTQNLNDTESKTFFRYQIFSVLGDQMSHSGLYLLYLRTKIVLSWKYKSHFVQRFVRLFENATG